jgi:VIT1/CCC1 family predicted Fe2+/Mn2+ transporter
MFRRNRVPLGADNFLSVLEGIEGGFAIFAGIIIGLSFQGVDRRLLLVTAIISIIVNAVNASSIRYSSEHYVDELDGRENYRWTNGYFVPAFIEFLVYGFASIISVLPLLFIDSLSVAIMAMTGLTLLFLFAAGWYRGNLLLKTHRVRDGIEVAGLGLLIIAAGAGSGWILSHLVA